MPAFLIIFIIFDYIGLFIISLWVAANRDDDTPLWEVILLDIFFTPPVTIILEMLKPYKIKK